MLAGICIIGSILFIGVGIFWLRDSDEGVPLYLIGIVIVLNGLPLFGHINDLSYIRHGAEYITIQEQAIEEIDEQLEDIDVPSQLINADTPVKELIAVKAQFVQQIAERRERMTDARISIERRKMGTGAWAVWLLGKE